MTSRFVWPPIVHLDDQKTVGQHTQRGESRSTLFRHLRKPLYDLNWIRTWVSQACTVELHLSERISHRYLDYRTCCWALIIRTRARHVPLMRTRVVARNTYKCFLVFDQYSKRQRIRSFAGRENQWTLIGTAMSLHVRIKGVLLTVFRGPHPFEVWRWQRSFASHESAAGKTRSILLKFHTFIGSK